MKKILQALIVCMLSQPAFANMCDDTRDPPVRNFKNDHIKYSLSQLAKELANYRQYTIPLDDTTRDLISGAVDDYATILEALSPRFTIRPIKKALNSNIAMFGPETALIMPALELIEQAYMLGKPEFSAPLVGVIGRVNPQMGFALLKHLQKASWGSLTSILPSRNSLLISAKAIFGNETGILADDAIMPALRGKITASQVRTIKGLLETSLSRHGHTVTFRLQQFQDSEAG
jgi:hypothetical protein